MLKMREQRRKAEDAKRIRGIVHENDKNNMLSHVQKEMGRLVHHDEQELLSKWEAWHWDVNKGGWPRSGAVRQGKTRRSGEHLSSQDVRQSLLGSVPTRDRKGTHQDRMGGD